MMDWSSLPGHVTSWPLKISFPMTTSAEAVEIEQAARQTMARDLNILFWDCGDSCRACVHACVRDENFMYV